MADFNNENFIARITTFAKNDSKYGINMSPTRTSRNTLHSLTRIRNGKFERVRIEFDFSANSCQKW